MSYIVDKAHLYMSNTYTVRSSRSDVEVIREIGYRERNSLRHALRALDESLTTIGKLNDLDALLEELAEHCTIGKIGLFD